jgi:tetratricopeptide (TPR) repeat protein
MLKTHTFLLVGIGIAAVIGAGFYFAVQNFGTVIPWPSGSQPATTTVSGVSGTGSYTVEPVEAKIPSLDRPITITADLSDEVKTKLTDILEKNVELLRKEPTRVDLWLQLGVNRKIAGDFEGAIEAWEYVAQVAPTAQSAVAHGNLGDLYMYFIKDYAKAVTRFNQAIALNPNMIDYYRSLFYLYKDIYKDPAKAQAILTQGLAANPGNKDLLGYQAELNAKSQ